MEINHSGNENVGPLISHKGWRSEVDPKRRVHRWGSISTELKQLRIIKGP